ncbi:MAG: molybdopterin-dependent oxidoreductase, partial [Chloroflexota bacterium]|nr:molybdopterin-dependent oxidoreductase [Chloroflexota bacterium]
SHLSVTLNPDGTAELSTPIFEQGTGSYTLEVQVIGEELGLTADRMHVGVWNTGIVDFDSGVGGSRVTRIGTQVAYAAAQEVKGELLNAAAENLGVPADRLTFADGAVRVRSTGETHAWPDLLQRLGRSVTGKAEFADTALPPVTAYVAQIAEVSVDPETGQVKLLRLTSAHDVGKIVNPIGHQGQVNGGAMQGIGYALMEELQVEDGRVTTLSFGDYKIPTMNDLPEMRTVLVESESGVGPYNVKSIGENSTIPVAAAIANAVEDAVGVRIKDLPITAEKVYRALKEKRQS